MLGMNSEEPLHFSNCFFLFSGLSHFLNIIPPPNNLDVQTSHSSNKIFKKLTLTPRSAFKIVSGKPAGKRPLGRPRRRWEENIRMNLKEIGIQGIGLIRFRIGIIGQPF